MAGFDGLTRRGPCGFALDQMTEDLRQGESIDVSSDADTVRTPSYVDGSATTVIWRTTGSAAPR